ncbi:MAG: serine/threonine-protein kinase RsbW [Pseudonocardiales bacterium]|nr:serine/threonine-protein kinase RsbW [Pseudonocardiales bacterium]
MTYRTLRQRLAVNTSAPSAARRAIRRWLALLDWPGEESDDLVVTTSEAVANAVDHAHPAGQPATAISLQAAVRVHEDGTLQVRITVEDGGRWKPPTADSGFRGRGVLLMRALSESVQFQTTDAGTRVVMDSHRSAPPAAALPEPRSAIVPPVPPEPQ